MIDDHYLEAGLIALSRVGESHWNEGHTGAAVIAAYYFAREQHLDDAAVAALARQINRLIAKHEDLFEPHDLHKGARQGRDADVAPLVTALDHNIGDLRAIGHNVIFATLALKALQQMPWLATPATVAGLVSLLRQFDDCQSASKIDPQSACNIDPPERHGGGCPGSQ